MDVGRHRYLKTHLLPRDSESREVCGGQVMVSGCRFGRTPVRPTGEVSTFNTEQCLYLSTLKVHFSSVLIPFEEETGLFRGFHRGSSGVSFTVHLSGKSSREDSLPTGLRTSVTG